MLFRREYHCASLNVDQQLAAEGLVEEERRVVSKIRKRVYTTEKKKGKTVSIG